MNSTIIFLFQQVFYFSIPLMITALGSMFSNRSGVTNIGIESIMIMGAFAGSMYLAFFQVNSTSMLAYLSALLVAGLAGMVFALLHAFCSITLKANQSMSGISLNMLAPALCVFVDRLIFGRQQIEFYVNFMVSKVPVLGDIPIIGPIFFQKTYISTYIGLIILIISALILFKTKFGLRLRACGEFPQAADSVGINVYTTRYICVLISGFLAGMAGQIFVITTSNQFNCSVSGYGFLATAVMIFGQWNPIKICFASFFFGLFKTISATYSGIPFLFSLGISQNVYKMIPYNFTLLTLIFTSRSSAAPKAAGKPFEKGQR